MFGSSTFQIRLLVLRPFSFQAFLFIGSFFLIPLGSLTTPLASAAVEVAKIQGTVITLDEFEKQYKDNLKYFRYKAPTKRNVLDELVNRELGIQEAKKLGLDKDPETIEKMNTILYHALIDKKLASKFEAIRVSEKEIESYYEKNPEIRTSQIFVQVRFDANKNQEAQALEKIKAAEAALKKGDKAFSEVVKQFSEGAAALNGGDLDFQTKDKLDEAYYNAAVALKKIGAVSSIVRSQFGYHIIKLTGTKDVSDIDRGYYKRMIFDEKRAQIFDSFMAELKQRYNVKVHYDAFKEEEPLVKE